VPVLDEASARVRALAALLASVMERRLADARRAIESEASTLATAVERSAERRRSALAHAAGRLHALSPLATLARGYSLARDERGATLASVERFAPDMPFTLLLRDGQIDATVVRATAGDRSTTRAP
jgi:exodeoxyribonuclease VII large subunit